MNDNMQPGGIRFADTREEIEPEAKFELLATFSVENEYPQLVHIHTPEFSAVCPGTGLPDIGRLDIEYLPNGKCVELKSLKYYLFSFRNEGIFQEPVADIMFGHLLRLLSPHYLKLVLAYNTRGGFDTTVTLEHGDRKQLNPDTVQRV